ncbi:uncharacterized protein LOC132178090 [Corylus avellana]|uniref:uncharacterized protein LOC132178090 n=1 Tax=Corylus avellana TaxID=13451 RepID=UPI00286B3943|nr:uncharacterized protein LOC132178090 [Corylus avellana]
MVSNRVIEANPEKIQVVQDMQSPKNMKRLQQLTDKIAALNRFISRSTDKCLPFFKILRKVCEQAFEQLKKCLASPPLLSRTIPREALYLHLTVSPTAFSAVLVQEEGVQKLVYFISRALRGSEERYVQIEKLAFTLTISSRKLRPSFQAHTIRVLTEYPLKKVLQKLDLSGRLASWAIEIREFDIDFVPRNAIMGQALIDFLAEFTNLLEIKAWPKDETWVIYVDGSCTRKNGGAGLLLITQDGEELCSSLRLEFKSTNNEAPYEAVLERLSLAREIEAKFVEVRSNSQVIVGHIRVWFEAKGEKMKLYLEKVQNMQNVFKKFCIIKVPRQENERADHLAQMGSSMEVGVEETEELVQILLRPAVTKELMVLAIEAMPKWAEELVEYLENGTLLADQKKSRPT